MSALTSSPAWQALAAHRPSLDGVSTRALFAADAQRFARMSREACGLFVDWSKHRVTDETIALLLALARQADVEGWRDRMFAGDKINNTERRAVHFSRSGASKVANAGGGTVRFQNVYMLRR